MICPHLIADDESNWTFVQDLGVQTECFVRYDEDWAGDATTALSHEMRCNRTPHSQYNRISTQCELISLLTQVSIDLRLGPRVDRQRIDAIPQPLGDFFAPVLKRTRS